MSTSKTLLRSRFDRGCSWEWLMSPTLARRGEMIIESGGIIMASLTGDLTFPSSSLATTWAAPVGLHPTLSFAHTQHKRQTRTGARLTCTLHRLGIALCCVEQIDARSYRSGALTGKSLHVWTTCTFSSVTLMGTSTLSRENACDERIISAAEHVSGHYSHTVWWHT